MQAGKVAGWLNTSASFAQPGNTALTGRHQAKDLAIFHGLWALEPGDEITLYAASSHGFISSPKFSASPGRMVMVPCAASIAVTGWGS